jgi:hypothetical protein
VQDVGEEDFRGHGQAYVHCKKMGWKLRNQFLNKLKERGLRYMFCSICSIVIFF